VADRGVRRCALAGVVFPIADGDEGGLNMEQQDARSTKARPTYTISWRRRPAARRGGAMTFGGGTRSGQKRRSSSTWRISSTRLLCSSTCMEERRRRSGLSSRRWAHDIGERRRGVEPCGWLATRGERSVRCAIPHRPSKKKVVDKSLTGDD
jgi:hypothetical protein